MESVKKLVRRPISLAQLDTVKYSKRDEDSERPKALELLRRAEDAWNNMDSVRRQRSRAMRFAFGDQWGDPITIYIDGEMRTMTMREYLAIEGHVPMQTNQIASMVNTVVGVLIKEQNEPVCNAIDRDEQQYGELITTALQANCNKNKMNRLYKLAVKDMVIGGIAGVKERYGFEGRREDSWTEYVNPNFLIMETSLRDPNFKDMQMIGCWYEMPKSSLIAKVVKSRKDYELIDKIYPQKGYQSNGLDLTEEQDLDNITFLRPTKPGYCAVAEIWTKETKERIHVHDTNEGTYEMIDADDREMLNEIKAINAERRSLAKQQGFLDEEIPTIDLEYFIDEYWYCRLIAPDGTVLWEEESPYPDRLHPFSLMVTPFVDGRIQGYITDAIDHQIAMNRAIVLQDWIARNQVKGFTMIPEALVPDGMSHEEFVQGGMNLGNFFFYDTDKLKGAAPQVFHGGAVSYDATNYISTLKTLMESSTAISGAIQGKTPYSGTSAALYAQQTQNSSTPIASLLEDVRSWMEEVCTKKAKNITEFYTPERFALIAGSLAGVFDNANLKLNEVADIEYDLVVKASTSTPVYRAIANDQLLAFFQTGSIDLQTLLEVGDFPFGDQLLQKLQARQAEMQAAQQGQMGEATREASGEIENPVEQKDYGVPVTSTRQLVE